MKKKKESEQFERAASVICGDKLSMSEECKTMVLKDLKRIIEEYFHLQGEVNMTIENEEGIYKTKIDFNSDRIMPFCVLK